MARLIAIDWDRLEARAVVGRTQAGGVAVEQAVAVPIELPAQENSIEGLAEQLGKALGSLRVSKAQVLSAIGRSSIELRTMDLPPAPDEELPDMVRFQAMREFSSLTESSPLDFMPLGAAGQEDGQVMAASIPSDLDKQVREAITEQGHESSRCVMRPASAASLALRKMPAAKSKVTLIISQQADSAELAVANHGTVVFTRSFRLPANWHPGETGEPLLGEVRRTIAAAQNQLGGSKVEQIIVFGTAKEHSGLQARLADRTKLPVEGMDPFDDLVVGGTMPENPERFAALIGMLQDEAHEVAPVIDFHNPRKRPEPESNRRQVVLYTMTAATMLLGLVFMWWWKHQQLNNDIAQAQWRITQVKEENRKLRHKVNLSNELKAWKKADKNWLDELLHLSNAEGGTPEDFRLEMLNGKTRPDGRGSIMLRGRAKTTVSRQTFQNKMADEAHDVVPGMVTIDEKQDEKYPILFSTTVLTDSYIDNLDAPAPKAPPPNTAAPDVTESSANTTQDADSDSSKEEA